MTVGRRKVFKKHELYFIQGHFDKMTVEEICDELDIKNIGQVEELVAEFRQHTIPKAYDQMVHKEKRAVAMTEAASQMGDEERRKAKPSLRKDCIHTIDESRE